MLKMIPRTLSFETRYSSIALGIIGICFFVFFPCLVEVFELGSWDKGFKKDFGLFVSDKSIPIYDIIRHVVARVDVFSKEEYFHNEGFAEKSSGLFEFGDLHDSKIIFVGFLDKFTSRAMGQYSADNGPSNNATDTDECNKNYIRHLNLLLGGVIGWAIGAILVVSSSYLFKFFTQR